MSLNMSLDYMLEVRKGKKHLFLFSFINCESLKGKIYLVCFGMLSTSCGDWNRVDPGCRLDKHINKLEVWQPVNDFFLPRIWSSINRNLMQTVLPIPYSFKSSSLLIFVVVVILTTALLSTSFHPWWPYFYSCYKFGSFWPQDIWTYWFLYFQRLRLHLAILFVVPNI